MMTMDNLPSELYYRDDSSLMTYNSEENKKLTKIHFMK